MEAIREEFQAYLDQHFTKESDVLQALDKETYQKTIQPYMLSGAYQGRFLALVSKMISPKCIVELGTFTGYSALCLAEGLQPSGVLYTVDRNDELSHISKKYFEESSYNEKIKLVEGNATDFLEAFNDNIDLAFIDADKSNYINYYEQLLPKMKSGGVILTDNVLWYGKVLKDADEKDLDTQVLKEFNTRVTTDNRVEVVILPIRDGISLIRKK